ncbi:hypothetical protein [Rhodococcoides corynebacterioides]|uniref:hypothetical protein n=1 Tax=Rhodococcoides corynebacterioides TaxID=53972 RepID=UPI001C9B1BB5|nr:hypothetical protein [Rhodococcus corynebacterioides]MBY6350655.1 hypothetical protein [Rhodococcus corynebacterioides]MBY6363615.1 hypothetical protein [Rhodococcus corynebacterioides]
MTHTARRATLALLTVGAAAGALLAPGVAAAAPLRGPDLQVVRSSVCTATVTNRGDATATGVRLQYVGIFFANVPGRDIAPGASDQFGYIDCNIAPQLPVVVVAYAGNGETNPFDNLAQVNP